MAQDLLTLFFAVILVLFLVEMVAYVKMLTYSRIGVRLLFKSDWWRPSRAQEYLKPEGMRYRRYAVWGMFACVGAMSALVIAVVAVSAAS
jgi:hypothetical protein